MAKTVIINGGGATTNRTIKICDTTINSRTIDADVNSTQSAPVVISDTTINSRTVNADVNSDAAIAMTHDYLQHEIDTKQNLGFTVLDKYLLNPTLGVITDKKDLDILSSYLVNKVSINTNIYYLTLSNASTLIYFCTSSYVTLNQLTLNRATGQFQLAAAGTSSTYHNQLHNLDYASSGHTGFAGIEFGTTAEWDADPSYIPPLGMLVVYTDHAIAEDGTLVPGIKVGDGNAYLVHKPFIGEDLAEILNEHIADLSCHITEEERVKWNNKLNFVAPEIGSDLLVFNRN